MQQRTIDAIATQLEQCSHQVEPTRFVTISGPSGAGKSYAAEQLAHLLAVPIIPTDAYYLPDNLIPSVAIEDGAVHYDHPAALQLGQLAIDMLRLQGGDPIVLPDTGEHISPARIIVVEGIVANYPTIRALAGLAVCVTAPPVVRAQRRAMRDAAHYGRDPDSTLWAFWHIVEPDYQRFHAENDYQVDLTIDTI